MASVTLCVRALLGERLELSTPNLVQMQSVAVASRAKKITSNGRTSRSHCYENVTSSHSHRADADATRLDRRVGRCELVIGLALCVDVVHRCGGGE